MKRLAPIIALFLCGAAFGWFIAPSIFRWFASALGSPLAVSGPREAFTWRIHFTLGYGVLFAVAGLAGRTMRSGAIYLLAGLAVSAAVVGVYCSNYTAVAADIQLDLRSAFYLEALPTLRIPLSGAGAILLFASVRIGLHANAGRRVGYPRQRRPIIAALFAQRSWRIRRESDSAEKGSP